MAGGGGGSSTTRVEPPKYQLPYLESGLQSANTLYNQQSGGVNMVAPFSQDTQRGMDQIRAQATGGTGIISGSNNLAGNTLNGNYLNSNPAFGATAQGIAAGQGSNPVYDSSAFQSIATSPANNPYLDQQFNRAAMATQGALASQFAGSGRNIGASENLRSEQLNSLANQIYGGAYEGDRSRQLQALGMQAQGNEDTSNRQLQALGLQSQGYDAERNRQQGVLGLSGQLNSNNYADAQQLLGIGAQQENLNQQQLNAPGQSLDQYLQRVSGNYGQTTVQPNNSNRGAGILGGAMLGNQLGGQYGYGGIGSILGGLLGGYG